MSARTPPDRRHPPVRPATPQRCSTTCRRAPTDGREPGGRPPLDARHAAREHALLAAGDYEDAYRLFRQAYDHMVMTGDTLADAILAQNPDEFGG
jgi:hypothetical protein